MYKVDNAVIMAAGASSRFAPLSYECPKALIDVKGEILIERQIRQLLEAGIREIYIVTGYKAEQFEYLREKYGIHIVENKEYLTKNNHSSIYAVRDILRNTYICSADNYFSKNPFESQVDDSYYAALYSDGPTNEWCMQTDANGYITDVRAGGSDAWYMLGHAFWSEEFSEKFKKILVDIYDQPETKGLFWEDIFINNIADLPMRMRKYEDDVIFEFDSLDELRLFDTSYVEDTRSSILKYIALRLGSSERELHRIVPMKTTDTNVLGIQFEFGGERYGYTYSNQFLWRILE